MLTVRNAKLFGMPRSKETFRLEVADRLHSAAIHLLRHARKQDVLARAGPAQLSALSVLVFGGPMALGQLAAAEQVKAPTMSRIVAGLKRSGLARIEADAKDARRIRVTPTAKGEKLMQEARVQRIRLLAETLGGLKGPELDTLFRAAELMERAVRQGAGKK
ncbi:MAG: MarR family transcriptional regulator [Acidobacteriia bacterium]|nr:MarR family transcriptional regulator [Terriglobia bacterium]